MRLEDADVDPVDPFAQDRTKAGVNDDGDPGQRGPARRKRFLRYDDNGDAEISA